MRKLVSWVSNGMKIFYTAKTGIYGIKIFTDIPFFFNCKQTNLT